MRRSQQLLLLFLVLAAAPLKADPLIGELKERALQYFLDHTNPKNGLVRDRAVNRKGVSRRHPDYLMASVAASGFGYAILSHAAKEGRLDAKKIEEQVYRGLKFSLEKLPHYKGWFYHFMDWDTGARFGNSEVSTVDTAWFLAGALYAGKVWGGRVAALASELYERVDFLEMMTHGGKLPDKKTLSMGWFPESGFLPYQWDTYAEHMFLILLGLGHPKKPLPAEAWTVFPRPLVNGAIGGDLPLFTHQYSHWFIDFKSRQDAYGNYFVNSLKATRNDRAFCAGQKSKATYREGFWGLSASGSADGYFAFSPALQNGTVCPSCVAGSLFLEPQAILEDVRRWVNGSYAAKIWGVYGLNDSINLDRGWFDTDVIGITVAGVYFSVVNEADGSFWKAFEQVEPISLGLKRAGFLTVGKGPASALLLQ